MNSNAAERLRNILNARLEQRGSVAEFCRKTGLARNTVESWLAGISSPNVRNLDTIAEALGVQPWALIKPDDSTNSEAKVAEDALLNRVLAVWGSLNEYQRGRVADIAEALSSVDGSKKVGQPVPKKQKTGA